MYSKRFKLVIFAFLLSLPLTSLQAWPGSKKVDWIRKKISAISFKKFTFWQKANASKKQEVLPVKQETGTKKILSKKTYVFSKMKTACYYPFSKIVAAYNYIAGKIRARNKKRKILTSIASCREDMEKYKGEIEKTHSEMQKLHRKAATERFLREKQIRLLEKLSKQS